MKMLDTLRDHLPEIERSNDWEHGFVEGLLVKQEENRLGKLTGKQFAKLSQIYEKYCA